MKIFLTLLIGLLFIGCGDDDVYLHGYLKRISDAVVTPCDPYGLGKDHTCIVIAKANEPHLLIYDATARELVLSSNPYDPLKINVPIGTKLAIAENDDNKSAFILGLNSHTESLFLIRRFLDQEKRKKTFSTPIKINIEKGAYDIKSFLTEDNLVALISYPQKNLLRIYLMDPLTGEKKSEKSFDIEEPRKIAIAKQASHAVISHRNSNKISKISIEDILSNKTSNILTIDMPTIIDKIYIDKDKSLALSLTSNEIYLIDTENFRLEKTYSSTEKILSALILEKEIFLATIGGKIKRLNSLLEDKKIIDLKNEKNLAFTNIHIAKLLFAKVIEDGKIKTKKRCENQIFIISAYAEYDGQQIEGQSYFCKNENTANPLIE